MKKKKTERQLKNKDKQIFDARAKEKKSAANKLEENTRKN